MTKMKLENVKLLQKVRLARVPPMYIKSMNGAICYRGPADFPYEEYGSIGMVTGIFCEKASECDRPDDYYPIIQVTNCNLGHIEVPPETLEPYPPKIMLDFDHPIGISIKGDMVYAIKNCD